MGSEIVLKEIKINEATVRLKSDGIIYVLFHKNVKLDVALQMLLLNIYKEISDGIKRPFLFEASEGVKVTKEAKANAIRIEDEAPGIAYAVVANSLPYMLVANFYVKIKKPKLPYKVFNNNETALAWLKSFLPQASPLQ
jgi:hypothetical protein